MKGNAQIKSTFLGYGDHGCLTIYLHLEQGCSRQSFGGYALDGYNNYTNKREERMKCGLWIQRILEVVGVKTWDELVGKYVRVIEDNDMHISAIWNIIKDDWFFPNN